jgi:oligopeptide/dipeptide ABC transporter ATP-binding protein
MNSIPNLDRSLPEDRMLPTITGMVPSLLDLPMGCNFQERCPKVMAKCQIETPPVLNVNGGHLVRCWLYG